MKTKERIPTWNQASTIERLMTGWELVISIWPEGCGEFTGKERIFYRKPDSEGIIRTYDTIDCSYPKIKRHQMSHMERYGWVTKIENGWLVTDEGKKAHERYKRWFAEATKSKNGEEQ